MNNNNIFLIVFSVIFCSQIIQTHYVTTYREVDKNEIAAIRYTVLREYSKSLIIKDQNNVLHEIVRNKTTKDFSFLNYEPSLYTHFYTTHFYTFGSENSYNYPLYLIPRDTHISSNEDSSLITYEERGIKRQRSEPDTETDSDSDTESIASTVSLPSVPSQDDSDTDESDNDTDREDVD